jgi:hypothetical protein
VAGAAENRVAAVAAFDADFAGEVFFDANDVIAAAATDAHDALEIVGRKDAGARVIAIDVNEPAERLIRITRPHSNNFGVIRPCESLYRKEKTWA